MSGHTKEPWFIEYDRGAEAQGIWARVPEFGTQLIGEVFSEDCGDALPHEANARRIVSCVNALAGLDPAALPALIEAARAMLPKNINLDTPHLRDSDTVPLDVPIGELRALRTALAKLQGDAALTDGEVGNG